MVEPPGTAPGSEPIITGAFIAIVGVAPDRVNIGGLGAGCKAGWLGLCPRGTIPVFIVFSMVWLRTFSLC